MTHREKFLHVRPNPFVGVLPLLALVCFKNRLPITFIDIDGLNFLNLSYNLFDSSVLLRAKSRQ